MANQMPSPNTYPKPSTNTEQKSSDRKSRISAFFSTVHSKKDTGESSRTNKTADSDARSIAGSIDSQDTLVSTDEVDVEKQRALHQAKLDAIRRANMNQRIGDKPKSYAGMPFVGPAGSNLPVFFGTR